MGCSMCNIILRTQMIRDDVGICTGYRNNVNRGVFLQSAPGHRRPNPSEGIMAIYHQFQHLWTGNPSHNSTHIHSQGPLLHPGLALPLWPPSAASFSGVAAAAA